MRMYINLRPDETEAICRLAKRERRHPREQAALLIRRGLERAGLLPAVGDRKAERGGEVQETARD